MKRILFVILAFVTLCGGTARADVQQATGEGPSREQALAIALRSAVEQGVGTFIKSTSTVVDSQLVDDKILSHSKGYVTGYKILQEGKNGDVYSVTVSATIDSKQIKDDVDALTILRKIVGNPRILVAFSHDGAGVQALRSKSFVEEINNGIEEALTDKQFRVVDKAASEKFAQQIAETHDINIDLNKAAAYGLKFNAEYTLLYSFSVKSGKVTQRPDGFGVVLPVKARLIDNTRAQVITNKTIEVRGDGQTAENALEKAGRAGGKEIIVPVIEVLQQNWMDMLQNGALYTVVIDGVNDPEEIARFTEIFEKFPLVNTAKEVESGGGKTTFEATYKGKRDQLDRDVLRAAKELGWKVTRVRAEDARSSWKKL
ncbi:MAG TPA: hypothetical protein VIH45_10390 [Desulfuromonadaceae bacterium]